MMIVSNAEPSINLSPIVLVFADHTISSVSAPIEPTSSGTSLLDITKPWPKTKRKKMMVLNVKRRHTRHSRARSAALKKQNALDIRCKEPYEDANTASIRLY